MQSDRREGLSEDRRILIARYMVEAPEPIARAKQAAEQAMRREALEVETRWAAEAHARARREAAERVARRTARASLVEEARRTAAGERLRREALEEVARRAAAAEERARREAAQTAARLALAAEEEARRRAGEERARREADEPAEHPATTETAEEAARETTAPWAARLGATAALAVLIFFFSWAFTGKGGFTSLAVALATIGGSWFLVAAWYVLTIAPRIERGSRDTEEKLGVLLGRRNLADELRKHMVACRLAAREAREAEIGARGRGDTIAPEEFHRRALSAARDAEERLARFGKQTGQGSYRRQILEISGAVRSRQCATPDEAIEQLEALADVLERQLASGDYW